MLCIGELFLTFMPTSKGDETWKHRKRIIANTEINKIKKTKQNNNDINLQLNSILSFEGVI